MKSAGKARNNGLYRHIRTSKEIIRNLLNDYYRTTKQTQQALSEPVPGLLYMLESQGMPPRKQSLSVHHFSFS